MHATRSAGHWFDTWSARGAQLVLAVAVGWTAVAGLGSDAVALTVTRRVPASNQIIKAVGAENEYANVLGQVGGKYVSVSSILNNPNTDPHSFESSPRVSEWVSAAQLIVQNGLGYDEFMNKIEAAAPNSARKVITVQTLLGLPDRTPNPHLWYKPTTMPDVARAIAADLGALQPAHRAYFQANAAVFVRSLDPWTHVIASFKAEHAGTKVATTEPVADYLLQAMGADNLTPFGFQADVMNGVDPAPEDIAFEERLLSQHKVAVFVYNEQVVDSLTTSFLTVAKRSGIPVVGVFETMPTPGLTYQSWMLSEADAIEKAVTDKVSTERL